MRDDGRNYGYRGDPGTRSYGWATRETERLEFDIELRFGTERITGSSPELDYDATDETAELGR